MITKINMPARKFELISNVINMWIEEHADMVTSTTPELSDPLNKLSTDFKNLLSVLCGDEIVQVSIKPVGEFTNEELDDMEYHK